MRCPNRARYIYIYIYIYNPIYVRPARRTLPCSTAGASIVLSTCVRTTSVAVTTRTTFAHNFGGRASHHVMCNACARLFEWLHAPPWSMPGNMHAAGPSSLKSLDLNRAVYVLYGFEYIDLVSLDALQVHQGRGGCAHQPTHQGRPRPRPRRFRSRACKIAFDPVRASSLAPSSGLRPGIPCRARRIANPPH